MQIELDIMHLPFTKVNDPLAKCMNRKIESFKEITARIEGVPKSF